VSADDRDRRADGRPENARPRDRTGRPLPYDTTETELLEEWEYDTVEEALELGVRLWDEERWFEAHECLEDVWHAAPDADRDFWQGVIQVAVAGVHHQRGNPTGAAALLDRARAKLERYPAAHRGVDVAGLCRHASSVAVRARETGETAPPPAFPAVGAGPWFALDADADGPAHEPTPVPDEQAWEAARRPRRDRRPPSRSEASPLPRASAPEGEPRAR
jgi:uncharacterized protein